MDLLGGYRSLGIRLDIGPGALVLVPAGVRLIFQGMTQAAYTATPITPTSQTCGCCSRTDSISTGDTWLPLTLIKSCGNSQLEFYLFCHTRSKGQGLTFLRSTIYQLPSSSTYPTSPVLIQPPAPITCSVAAGLFQYPRVDPGVRIQMSPTSPVFNVRE